MAVDDSNLASSLDFELPGKDNKKSARRGSMDNAAAKSAVAFSQKTLEVASDLGSLNQLPP